MEYMIKEVFILPSLKDCSCNYMEKKMLSASFCTLIIKLLPLFVFRTAIFYVINAVVNPLANKSLASGIFANFMKDTLYRLTNRMDEVPVLKLSMSLTRI